MSMLISCTCGKRLQVKEDLAGKRVKCPGCGTLLEIAAPPTPEAEEEPAAEMENVPQAPKAKKPRKKAAKKRAKATGGTVLGLRPMLWLAILIGGVVLTGMIVGIIWVMQGVGQAVFAKKGPEDFIRAYIRDTWLSEEDTFEEIRWLERYENTKAMNYQLLGENGVVTKKGSWNAGDGLMIRLQFRVKISREAAIADPQRVLKLEPLYNKGKRLYDVVFTLGKDGSDISASPYDKLIMEATMKHGDMWKLVSSGNQPKRSPEQMQALERLEKTKSRVYTDESDLEAPVVEISLSRDVTDDVLRELKVFPQLRKLSLMNSKVTDAGMKTIRDLSNLEELVLGYTAISDEGVKELRQLPRIKLLWLSHTKVTDAGVKDVAAIKSLRELHLGGTRVSGQGLQELQSLPELVKLDLRACGALRDADMAVLAQFPKLQELDISNTFIKDEGFLALSKLKTLQKLRLTMQSVSPASNNAFSKALPTCKLDYLPRG